MRDCKNGCWLIALLFAVFGSALTRADQQNTPTEAELLALIKQIDQLQLPDTDEYELLYLKVDCAIETALVVSMSGNDKAISEITSLIQKLAANADELDEPWSRDSLLGYLAMMTVHQKGVDAAEAQAKAISMRGYQAEGLGLIASQQARR